MKYCAALVSFVPVHLAIAVVFAVPVTGCGLILDTAVEDSGPGELPDSGSGRDSAVVRDADSDAGRQDASRDSGPVGIDATMPPPDPDPTMRPFSCEGVPDFTPCHAAGHPRQVCVRGGCYVSWCGDGVVDSDAGEQCDDGNDYEGDACGNDCGPVCDTDSDCDDGRECTGVERCEAGACQPGISLTPGTMCAAPIGLGVCDGIYCYDPSSIACGNGLLGSGEACDDGNRRSGDGCEPDCTITCDTDRDCADLGFYSLDPCNPVTCSSEHACVDPPVMPSFACYRDYDGDGYGTISGASLTCGTRCPSGSTPLPGDCDEEDRRAHPGTRLYFSEAASDGGWDFNCDGAETLYGGSRVFGGCVRVGEACRGSGWEGAAPPCEADYATWVSCVAADDGCAPAPSTTEPVCH